MANQNAVALWRSLERVARLADQPAQPPTILPHLIEAWMDGWWQENRKLENHD